jgi:hypothetical protein
VLAGAGVHVPMSDLFGPSGQQLLSATRLPVESRARIDSLRRVITALDFEIDTFAWLVAGRLRTDPGYRAIQAVPGIGPVAWPPGRRHEPPPDPAVDADRGSHDPRAGSARSPH